MIDPDTLFGFWIFHKSKIKTWLDENHIEYEEFETSSNYYIVVKNIEDQFQIRLRWS